MNNKFYYYKFSLKETIIGAIVIVIIFVLGKWAYFFLPPEYAAKTQIPNMEILFAASIAMLSVYIYKIVKEINEIKKQLVARVNIDSSKSEESSD